ncbi:MAG: MFS transporter [Meiothermus sp.]|nr:MFS transporter [Meiothermus sp.]
MAHNLSPTRWQIPLVLAVTVFVHYLDRNALPLALPKIAQEFGWTDKQIGSNGDVLLAAFFVTYGIAQIFLSPLAERFGPKRSLMLAITGFSVFTILVWPLGFSLLALIILRLLLGLGESVHMPMNSAIVSRWFPASERARANSIYVAGILLAVAFAPLLVVPLVNALGWREAFAVLGLVGLLVCLPLVWRFVQDTPPTGRVVNVAFLDVKASYMRDGRFWLYTVAGVFNAFCVFGILNWLPTYFNRARGINFEDLGWPLFVVFVSGIVGVLLWAYVGDRLGSRNLLASLGFLIAALCVWLTSSADSLSLVVLLFALGVFTQSAYNAQEFATVQRLLPPDKVGAGTGLYNGLTVLLGGVGGSLVPGSIVAATGSFQAGILSVMGGAIIAGVLMFVVFRVVRY